MLFVTPDYLVSKVRHPTADDMFSSIDCILEPRMPILNYAKVFLWDVYGDYLHREFRKVHESSFWVVWVRGARGPDAN